MKQTETYQIESQWYWHFLGDKPHFNQFRFELDNDNQFWPIPEPTNFLQSKMLLGIGRKNDGLIQTELAKVEKLSDNRLSIGLQMYLNVFSVFLLRVQGWNFTVSNLNVDDYALLTEHKNSSVFFLHKL